MAAHRYWRLYITAAQSGGYTSVMELVLATTSGGASVATGGTAICSSTGFGWTPDLAFNGTTAGNGWHSGGNALPTIPEWIGYDFGAGNAKDIVQFRINDRPGNTTTQAARDFALQFSDDGAIWTTQKPYTGQTADGSERAYAVVPIVAKQRWRLYITAQNGANVPGLAELVMRTVSGGANVCTGGMAAASSYYAPQGGFPPVYAFDGNPATFWDAATGSPQWIEYTFGAAQEIAEYAITAPPAANVNDAPRDFKLQYYTGDSLGTWVDADSQTGQTAWTSNQVRTFTLPSTSAAGTAATSQGQRAAAQSGVSVSGSGTTTQAQGVSAAGVVSVAATASTAQAQSLSAAGGIGNGTTAATAQGQSVSATGAVATNTTVLTAQAQSLTASSLAAVTGQVATGQVQGTTAGGSAQSSVNATASTAQAQGAAASASIRTDAAAQSAQAQTVSALGDVITVTDAAVASSQAQSTQAAGAIAITAAGATTQAQAASAQAAVGTDAAANTAQGQQVTAAAQVSADATSATAQAQTVSAVAKAVMLPRGELSCRITVRPVLDSRIDLHVAVMAHSRIAAAVRGAPTLRPR